ncbi:MAG: S8/S53 family peptidase [Defluviitaleaceae bacterium]|nr:S8/S53 family peptidase [Defluviitaleaceae bacterium]
MSRIIKKTTALILAVVLTVLGFSPSTVSAQEFIMPYEPLLHSNITAELLAYMSDMQGDDTVKVHVWITDVDFQAVEQEVFQAIGFSEESLMIESDSLFSPLHDLHNELFVEFSENYLNEDFDEIEVVLEFFENTIEERAMLAESIDFYISIKREIASEHYYIQNTMFAAQYLSSSDIYFQSKFSPMMIVELTVNEILELSKQHDVELISLYVNDYFASDFSTDIQIRSVDANITRDSPHFFNGQGVRVGMIETGRPELSGIPELNNSSIIRRGTGNNLNITPHASLVAAVINGSAGAAPRATVISTSAFFNVATNSDSTTHSTAVEMANIEWLISQNAHIINRSFGSSRNGSYSEFCRWIDHIVNHHNVTFVQAAGNGGANDFVGLQSFNAIVVGGIDTRNSTVRNNHVFWNSTSVRSGAGLANKPDVVAPATGFSVAGRASSNGTSFAAPTVAGVVAQMMSAVPTLRMRPDAIKAAIAASADRKTSGETLGVITDREGAGVINAIRGVNAISTAHLQNSALTIAGSTNTLEFNLFPMNTTTPMTVAISWLRRNTATGTTALTNFDLYIIGPNGNVITSSRSTTNNVELVRFTPTSTAAHRIRIVRVNHNNAVERLSYAIIR